MSSSAAGTVVALAFAGALGSAQEQAPCPRARPVASPPQATVIPANASPACQVKFVPKQFVLAADPARDVYDLAPAVTRSPDGRYFTQDYRSAPVHAWSGDGRNVRTFGPPGLGPGELPRGYKFISFGPEGRILVADANRRWSVFSRDLRFERSFTATNTGNGSGQTGTFVAPNIYIGTGPFIARLGGLFGIFDFSVIDPKDNSPRRLRLFGEPASAPGLRPRVTSSGGGVFWAASPRPRANGYELTLWSVEGRQLRSIVRDAPWFPSTTLDARGNSSSAVPPPELELVHADTTGLVVTLLMVPNPARWRNLSGERDTLAIRRAQNGMIDIRLEVIDTRAGMLVGSLGPMSPDSASRVMPFGFLTGTLEGYRRSEEDDGTARIQFIDLKLVTPPRR